MKPAFSKITIKRASSTAAKGSLKVDGPIDLEGNEEEAYFWVRVSKSDDSAEAVGTGEMSKRRLISALQASAHTAAASGPMWTATIPIEKGSFAKGDVVNIEAWAKVTTDQPKRLFHVYWEEESFPL
jgi:hypothetical protein